MAIEGRQGMTPAPDYAEIASRVNERLAQEWTNPLVFSAAIVGRVLRGETIGDYPDVIREIAAEVEKEQNK